MQIKKNAIIGDLNVECEVISALVNPSNPEEMVYVAKLDTNPDNIEVLWYFAPQIALKVNDNSTAALPADELPCTLRQIRGMREFGYQWHGILPIDKQLCLDLYHEGLTVYLLYADGSETEVNEESELMEDLVCVMYGVTVEDWLIHCGRLRDGEVIHYEADDEPFESVPVSTGKFRGVTLETGEEIEGYLLRCEGMVNPGKVYICPGVTYATNAYCNENGKRSYDRYAFGSFVEVVAASVVPANIVSDELMAYRRTGLKPSEIQEAVDLFKDTNASVPDEIIGWVQRASFHTRKCVEMEQKIKDLEQQLTGFQVREAKALKERLIERLAAESQHAVAVIFSEADGSEAAVKNVAITRAAEIALNEAIVSVFIGCDLQYGQLRTLDAVLQNELLSTIKKHLPKGKACYGENEIRDAIYDIVAE